MGRQSFTDPATGDPLSLGEEFSYQAQRVIRRWTFLVIVTIATVVVWTMNDAHALTWWNLSASYLAILVESIVGIGMFSMGRRDSVILRELRKGLDVMAEADKKRDAILAHLEAAAVDRAAVKAALDADTPQDRSIPSLLDKQGGS